MLVSLVVIHMLDGTGDPLVDLTTPIYTNTVIGKLKKGNERRYIGRKDETQNVFSVANLRLSTLLMSN